MMKLLKRVRVIKSGALAAEYALILSIIGGGIVVTAIALKGSISGALNGSANTISANYAS